MKRLIVLVLIVLSGIFIFKFGWTIAIELLAFQSIKNPIPFSYPTPTPVNLSAEKLMSIVNDWRYKQGLQPYTKSEMLCEFAQTRLQEVKTDWSHNGFKQHIKELHPVTNGWLAENLAKDLISEQATLDAWLISESHSKILKLDYKYSCIETEGTYAVQIFANF